MAGGLVAAFVLVFALMFLDVGVGGIKGADPTVKGGEFREVGFDFVGGFAAVTVGDFRVGVHDGLVGLEQLEGIEGAAEDAGEGGAVIGDGFVIGVGVAKGFSVGFGVFGEFLRQGGTIVSGGVYDVGEVLGFGNEGWLFAGGTVVGTCHDAQSHCGCGEYANQFFHHGIFYM